ncbi:MAG: PLP-dependent aminotransferase family protein, partial [Ruthenibacterium sp.]
QMLTRTDMQAHIASVCRVYRAKAEQMMAALDAKCPQIVYHKPQGGMFLWASLPDGVNMPEFVQKCLSQKLALVPGNALMVDTAAPCQNIRMNFSTPCAEQIERGVEIMAQVLRAMQ